MMHGLLNRLHGPLPKKLIDSLRFLKGIIKTSRPYLEVNGIFQAGYSLGL